MVLELTTNGHEAKTFKRVDLSGRFPNHSVWSDIVNPLTRRILPTLAKAALQENLCRAQQ